MNLVDYLGAISAIIGGAMVFCHAYLSGFKDRGFPGQPWPIRGAMLFLGLFLWLRAGMIYPAAHTISARYPNGHHVTTSEACVYGAFAVLLTFSLMHYFFSAHRWYAEGADLRIDPNDKPSMKPLPEQVKEAIREEMPKAAAASTTALLDGLGGPVKAHGGKA